MYLRSFAAAAALAAVSSGLAFAGTTSGTPFTVQVTVDAGCNIDTGSPTGTINFGTVAGTAAAPADVSGNMVVTCTNTTPYRIYFTSTNTVTGNTNRIMNAGGAENIGYQIRQGTTPIGNTPATGYSGTGNGSQQTTAINFHINSWTPITPGTYTDTVTMNVDF